MAREREGISRLRMFGFFMQIRHLTPSIPIILSNVRRGSIDE
jgi:hypothetical protein